jgi:hypothetical protein
MASLNPSRQMLVQRRLLLSDSFPLHNHLVTGLRITHAVDKSSLNKQHWSTKQLRVLFLFLLGRVRYKQRAWRPIKTENTHSGTARVVLLQQVPNFSTSSSSYHPQAPGEPSRDASHIDLQATAPGGARPRWVPALTPFVYAERNLFGSTTSFAWIHSKNRKAKLLFAKLLMSKLI